MAIKGQTRESAGAGEFKKYVGVFEANIIAINPTNEEYKSILDIELKEDSKATEYLSEKDGVSKVRIDVWLQEVRTKEKVKAVFFLEDNKRSNKDNTKKQYVNSIGMCSWASSEENLPTWFANRDYRVAYVGEEEFVTFLRTWLGKLDYSHQDTELRLDWKKVIVGNLKEWKELINGEWSTSVGGLATVKTVEKAEGAVSYQSVYNKAFFPGYSIKNMRMIDYNNLDVIRSLEYKKSKELKQHERFVINVTGEYGCKEFYTFREFQEYDPNMNLVESDKVISSNGADY